MARKIVAGLLVAGLFGAGAAEARTCGGAGQRPCALLTSGFFEIGDFCESDLIHYPFVICAPQAVASGAPAKAEQLARLAAEVYLAFSGAGTIDNIATLIRASGARSPIALQRAIESDPRFARSYELMRALGFRTMTVGLAGGGGFVLIGGGGEGGIALDTAKQGPAFWYDASYRAFGPQLSVGTDLVISGYVAGNRCIGGDAFGSSAYVDFGPGAGMIIWHDAAGRLAGLSVPVGLGGVGGGVTSVTATTTVRGTACPPPASGPPRSLPPPVVWVPPAPEPATVTVGPGDTLWAIAAAELGDGQRFWELYSENRPPLEHPDMIYPGLRLVLPEE